MSVQTQNTAMLSLFNSCCLMMCVLLLTCGESAKAASRKSDPLSIILERHRSLILDRTAPDAATIQEYQKTLQKDGRWLDVDYERNAIHTFYARKHLLRIEAMALAYAQADHILHGDKALIKKIHIALDHWLANNYKSPNWWHNVISTPRSLGKIAVLIDDELTGARREAALAAIAKCPIGRTGANLMDQAQIVMVRACLADDAELLRKAVNAIVGEIKVSDGEGIQEDWSYHQHGACSQPLSYGRVYLKVLHEVGFVVRGTPYEFPREKREIVSMFLLKGIQWMTRGIYTAPSTIDRQISRPGALRSGNVRRILRKWIEVDPENAPALKEFLARQNGAAAPLTGFRHYYRSDLSVYHRPEFSLFLKTRSKRVKGTEGSGRENLKGRPYLHTGDHYIIRDGSEYTALPPVWDWSRLPGLTMFEGIKGISPKHFVGGLGNGASGLTAMNYSRELRVRKLWAFHENLVVCLLGGWQDAEGREGLRTTLDQCALEGPVRVNTDEKTKTFTTGVHQLPKVRWVLHKGIGYVPLFPSTVSLRMGEAEGSWRQISARQSSDVVKENVFTCDLMHGESPVADGFILAPGRTTEELDRLTQRPPYEVIQNDRKLQCIRFEDGTFMAAFYEQGKVTVDNTTVFSIDRPCLALWNQEELRLCYPTNPKEGMQANVMWRGKKHAVTLPGGGRVLQLP